MEKLPRKPKDFNNLDPYKDFTHGDDKHEGEHGVPGTKSEYIYLLHREGLTPKEIRKKLKEKISGLFLPDNDKIIEEIITAEMEKQNKRAREGTGVAYTPRHMDF